MKSFLVVLAIVLASVPAMASAGHHPLDRGIYLYSSGQAGDAAVIAADLLREDPTDLEVHALYQQVWWSMGEQAVLLAQYRSWVESEPDNEIASVALAMLLRQLRHRVDEPAAEIRQLLEPLPEDPELRYWALDVIGSLDASESGEPVGEDNFRARIEAASASENERLQRRAILLRLRVEPVDTDLSSEVRRAVRQQPCLLEGLGYALWSDLVEGPTLPALRTFAETRAEAAVRTDDPILVLGAHMVFWGKEDEEGEKRAEAKLRELDPAWDDLLPHPVTRAIWDASGRFDLEVGLAELEALDADTDATGTIRVRLEQARARQLWKLDRDEEAHAAWLRSMHAGADDHHSAIQFASSAITLDQDRELALSWLDDALERLRVQDFHPEGDMSAVGLGAWQEYHNRQIGFVHHARGDLLRDLGRDEEVAPAFRAACLADDRAEHHEALAGLFADQGLDQESFEHRVRAVALTLDRRPDAYGEDGLPEALLTAWEARPYWHPGGFGGYMADRVTALADEEPRFPT